MKIILSSIFYTLITFLFIVNASASETLSYSGRLVNPNGSPVVGPVNLKVELAYSNSPTIIRCSQNFTNIILSNGVFHLNVNFDCGSPVTLSQVLTQIPANESAAIRVTNITDIANPKVYSFQALHSMPFANIAETSKQLVQMEATDGQVLKWDNATAKWKPGPAGGGGTVTSVSGTLPISVATGSSTAVISMPVANTSTSGYLSSADWNSFNTKEGTIAGGSALQYYRGDKSWQTLNTSVVPESGVTNLYFSNARVLGVPLDGFVAGPGVIVATDTVLQAFAKTQGQINSLTTDSAKYLIKNGTDSITGVVTVASPTGFLRLIDPPALFTDATNMAYVNSRDDLKVNKAGDTMSGVLTLDSDLKMKGGANYVTLKGHATSATYNLFLPQNAGTSGFVLSTDGNGNTTWINPASVANGTDTVTSASIVNGSIVDADINASAAIDQSKIANLSTDLAGKEPTVTNPSDTSKYYRGDKSWQTLNTTAVAEGTNLYFTNARVLGTDLLGLNTGVAGPIIAADTVLGAFGKLQYQVTDLKAKGQWEKNVNDIYYNAGNVGIGTTAPVEKLQVLDGNISMKTSSTTTPILKWSASDNSLRHYISGVTESVGGTTDELKIFNLFGFTSFYTGNAERMRITSSGNVGIGTVTPTSRLDILGAISDPSLNASDSALVNFRTPGHVQMAINAQLLSPYTISLQAKHSTANGNSYPLALNPLGGNVGIGTASPQAGLDVAMTGTGNSAIIVPRDTTANRPTTPVNGMIRYNTTSLKFEAYQNGVWTDMIASGAGTITSINGSSDAAQTFANGTSGTAPAWSTAAGVHTINIPMAATAGVTAGLISKTQYDAFNSKLGTTLNSGNIWVGNGSNVATAVAPSSDVSMTNAGAFTVTKLQGRSVSTTAPALGSFLKWDNILSQWAPTPFATCSGANQVMHYILLTDTWSCDSIAIDNLLPTQTGNSGKVLTTNGTAASWQTPAGVTGSGTTNYLPKFTAASALGNSLLFDDGSKVGIGTSTPTKVLDVAGSARFIDAAIGARQLTINGGSTAYVQVTNSTSGSAVSDGVNFEYNGHNFNIVNNENDATFGGPVQILSAGTSNSFVVNREKVGIGDYSPDANFEISLNAITTGNAFLVSSNDDADGDLLTMTKLGNVGIGTTTPGTGTKLSVEGQIRSKSFTTTLGAIDWQNGNSGTTSFNCGTNITFANLRDGGSYTLVVTDTSTTTCSFSTTTTGDDAATVSYRFLPANANRTASTHSVYSLQRIGTIVYVSWMTGF